MWDNATTMMVVEGIFVTLYMTLATTFMGYVLGLPMGIALVITAPKGLRPNKIIYKVLDVVVNVVRSFPFLILLIVIQPLTRIIVGKSYGPTATIVPLTLSAAPFIARMVESSLLEVDHGVIEAAQSMGANLWTIIWKVMIGEAKTSLIVNGNDCSWYDPGDTPLWRVSSAVADWVISQSVTVTTVTIAASCG